MRSLIIVLLASFFSCSNEKDLTLLASYKDNHLYLHEVLSDIEEEIKDTVDYVDKYIDSWIRKNVLLDHACGRICATPICPYPPGIPMIFPGENLNREKVEWLMEQKSNWPNKIPDQIRVVAKWDRG